MSGKETSGNLGKQLPAQFYVSITGLRVRSFWFVLTFWRHAVASKIQSEKAPGILHSDVKRINGIQHTLTAWENREAMKKFIYSGPHAQAIRVFRKIATGKTFGFEATKLPTWEEVHALWNEHGQDY